MIKGIGIMNRIMTLLKGSPFGKLYFEVTLILRNSLLESSVLQNIFYDMIFRMYPTHMRGAPCRMNAEGSRTRGKGWVYLTPSLDIKKSNQQGSLNLL